MPLIPYPNIPPLPGVPGLHRSTAGFAGAALTIVGELLPLNLFGPRWGIVTPAGSVALTPDSFIEFEYRSERKIPTYPVEQGGFASYNKVALPFDINVIVTCSGNGAMTKPAFLAAIQTLLAQLTLVSVVTPDATFPNCNLVHVDYRREARQGATLIIAQLKFQEIRVVLPAAPPTSAPSGATALSNGQTSVVPVINTGTPFINNYDVVTSIEKGIQ